MFRTPTTFIVGAGASKDFGLPLGSELKKKISDLLDIYFKYGDLERGDSQIVNCLRFISQENDQRGNPNELFRLARSMADALPLSLSIDNYLEAHQTNSQAIDIGKLGIARTILQAEQESSLFVDSRTNERIDLNGNSTTWVARFIQAATENVPKERAASVFENVTIISFNYDRCISHYVRQAIQAYYSLSDLEANEVTHSLKVLYPYGSLGVLPWQNQSANVSFGSSCTGSDLINVSRQIKTFTEQLDDQADLQALRSAVSNARNLIFLGFGFHRQNIELLTTTERVGGRRVLASAVGISKSDQAVITGHLQGAFGHSNQGIAVEFYDGNCSSLFDEYWRTITA